VSDLARKNSTITRAESKVAEVLETHAKYSEIAMGSIPIDGSSRADRTE
jgi:hypothetical protein